MRETDIETTAAAREEGAVVVDVREPSEYREGHVPGALSIPMGQLPGRVGEIDRDKPVHVICASGNRSQAMADLLEHQGFHAWSVAGGTKAWARSGRPLETGDPTRR